MWRRYGGNMSERLRQLAARKHLLVARSRLHRLELQHEAAALRRRLMRPRTVFAIASSAPVRPLVFSALTLALGRGRLSKVLRVAMAAVAIATAAHGMLERMRAAPPP